jgi:hypothetical protein
MVKTPLVVVTTLAALLAHVPTSQADDADDDDDDSPAFNMFGFGMAVGALPVRGTDTRAMSIGLTVEHPVFRKARVVAEYDWLWLLRRDASTAASTTTQVPRPEEHGTGHRASLGLRRELIGKGGDSTRTFLDGEVGATVALVNDSMTGAQLVPGGFTGLRVGWDAYSRREDSPSRTFELAVLVRAIVLRDGAGLTVGIGMLWGN